MKSKGESILDVPSIQKAVGERHKKFLQEYGSEIEKVTADHSLFVDIVFAKLYRIVLVFKQENIINDANVSEIGPCKKITLTKSHWNNYVNLITDGKDIIMEGCSYSTELYLTDNVHSKERFYNVSLEDFNWVEFASKLLDYIHYVIYDRAKVVETKFQNLFCKDNLPEEKFEITKINNIDVAKRRKNKKQ